MYPWSNDVKEIAPFLFCALFFICHVFEMPCYFFNKSHLVLSQHFNCRQLLIDLVWVLALERIFILKLMECRSCIWSSLPFLHWLSPAPSGAPNESHPTCVWEWILPLTLCKTIRSAWILVWQRGKQWIMLGQWIQLWGYLVVYKKLVR